MCSGQSQQKDSHRPDTTVSLTGTSLCTYAIEPTCTERYARWRERSGLVSPSYSIEKPMLQQNPTVLRVIPEHFAEGILVANAQDVLHVPNDIHFRKLCSGNPEDTALL